MESDKKPPSLKETPKERKYTQGVAILFSEDLRSFEICSEFKVGEETYNTDKEKIPVFVSIVHSEMEVQRITASMLHRMMNELLTVNIGGTNVTMRFPELIGRIAGETTHALSQNNQIRKNIIAPPFGRSN